MDLNFLWGAFCIKAIIDKNDNTLSMISVINGINAQISINKDSKADKESIKVPINFSLVMFFKRSDDNFSNVQTNSIRINVFDPLDLKITETALDLRFEANNKFTNSIVNFGLNVNKSGEYKFQVITDDVNKEIIGEVNLSIKLEILNENE